MTTNADKSLGAELRRVMSGKEAAEWARDLDVDRTVPYKWWNGTSLPRRATLQKIADLAQQPIILRPSNENPPKEVDPLATLERKIDVLLLERGISPAVDLEALSKKLDAELQSSQSSRRRAANVTGRTPKRRASSRGSTR